MAGYTIDHQNDCEMEFHVNEPFLGERIRRANGNKRVITLQLDGDELDAALWGLEHYRKGLPQWQPR